MEHDKDRRKRAYELFNRALALPEADRSAFIASECGSDAELKRLVEELSGVEAALPPTGSDPPPLGRVSLEEHDPNVGRRIGAYEIKDRIGKGGFGAVYRAVRRDDFKQYVAIKLLRRGQDTEVILKRFHQERKFLAALQHDNIAAFIDAGQTDDGQPYVVMEYIGDPAAGPAGRAKPIDQYCDDEKLTLRERLKLFQHVCSAVQFAHAKFVLHRDLKPSNILVTRDGVPKLLDFGVAKALDPTMWGTVITLGDRHDMTPEYASPEQVSGKDLDTRSDVYSLGVLLYELVTGHRPYYVTSAARVMQAEVRKVVCESEPKAPSEIVLATATIDYVDPTTETVRTRTIEPEGVAKTRSSDTRSLRRHLLGDLDNIVLYALRKEPERRYSSAQQLADDIQAYLEQEPLPVARPESRTYLLRKTLRRYRVPVAFAAALALALAGGIAGTTTFALLAEQRKKHADDRAKEALDAKAVAEQRLYLLTLSEAQRNLKDGSLGAALAALNDAPASLRGWEWGWLLSQDQCLHIWGDDSEVVGIEGAASLSVLTRDQYGALQAWDATTADLLFSCPGPVTKERFPITMHAASGSILLVTPTRDCPRVWKRSRDTDTILLSGHEGRVIEGWFSPDGARLLTCSFVGETERRHLQLWDTSTGRELPQLSASMRDFLAAEYDDDNNTVTDALPSPNGERLATGLSGGRILIWDATRYARPTRLEGPEEVGIARTIGQLHFTRDGTRVLRRLYNTARTYDTDTGAMLAKFHSEAWLESAEFSADGRWILTTAGPLAEIRDAATGTTQFLLQHPGRVEAAHFNEEASLVVTVSDDSVVRIWDVPHGRKIDELRLISSLGVDARFTCNGALTRVITCWPRWPYGNPRLWSFCDRQKIPEKERHKPNYWASSTHEEVVAAIDDRDAHSLRVWRTTPGGTVLRTLKHDEEICRPCVWVSIGRIATASGSHLFLWDAVSGTVLARHEANGDVVAVKVLFSSEDRRILMIDPDENAASRYRVRVLNRAGEQLCQFYVEGTILHADFSPNGERLLIQTDRWRLWDTDTGTVLGELGEFLERWSFSPNGTRLVTVSSIDGTCQLWDVASGEGVADVTPHEESTLGAAAPLVVFSDDSARLATVPQPGGSIILWDEVPVDPVLWSSADGARLGSLQGHAKGKHVESLRFSRDGSRVATAARDNKARIFDSATQKARLIVDHGAVQAACFSPDGARVATAGGSVARVWDVTSGNRILELEHERPVVSAEFSPDGSRIVTATEYNIRVWDAASGKSLVVLNAPASDAPASFSADGTRIVAGDTVWDSVPRRLRYREHLANQQGRDGGAIVKTWLESTRQAPLGSPDCGSQREE